MYTCSLIIHIHIYIYNMLFNPAGEKFSINRYFHDSRQTFDNFDIKWPLFLATTTLRVTSANSEELLRWKACELIRSKKSIPNRLQMASTIASFDMFWQQKTLSIYVSTIVHPTWFVRCRRCIYVVLPLFKTAQTSGRPDSCAVWPWAVACWWFASVQIEFQFSDIFGYPQVWGPTQISGV